MVDYRGQQAMPESQVERTVTRRLGWNSCFQGIEPEADVRCWEYQVGIIYQGKAVVAYQPRGFGRCHDWE